MPAELRGPVRYQQFFRLTDNLVLGLLLAGGLKLL